MEQPETIRQFVHPDSRKVVNCEWDYRHGAWVCNTHLGEPFNCCSRSMTPIFEDLRDAGFRELGPG